MALFNFFVAKRKPKQFQFKSRFYDAAAEDLQQRVSFKEKEIELKEKNPDFLDHSERIASAWRKTRKTDSTTSRIQILLIGFFLLLLWGYYEWGNKALYLVALVVPIYFYARWRMRPNG